MIWRILGKTVLAIALVALSFGGTVTTLYKVAPPKEPEQAVAQSTQTAAQSTQTVAKSTKATEYPTVPFTLFKPATGSPDSGFTLFLTSSRADGGRLTYSSNIAYGKGLTKGGYLYSVYAASDATFNPPSNCGSPGRLLSESSPMPCVLYEQSSPDLPAYYTYKQAEVGIQNTSVQQYMTLYAKKQNSVICISSADTTFEDLYSRIKDMQAFDVTQLSKSNIYLDGEVYK